MTDNIIGALVGMGPKSTIPFYERFIYESREQLQAVNDMDYQPLVMYSLPTPFIPNQLIDERLMKTQLIHGINVLVGAGAKIIAVPCNLVHSYFDEIQNSAGDIPVLNMIKIALNAIEKLSHSGKVAIVGTSQIIQSGLYQSEINQFGGELLANAQLQKISNNLISLVKQHDLSHQSVKSAWEKLLIYLDVMMVHQ